MTQQTQQQQQQPYTGGDYAERLVRVEKDVSGLKESMSALALSVREGFSGISTDMKAGTKRDWQPMGIAITVLIALGTLGTGYLSSNQTRLEAMIAKQEMRAERYVPREDLDARFNTITQRRDDLQRLTDARIERAERDLDGVQKAVVPRGEHEQMWTAQRARDADLQRQTDQNRQGLYDLNTPRDTLQAIQRRLDEVERAGRRSPER